MDGRGVMVCWCGWGCVGGADFVGGEVQPLLFVVLLLLLQQICYG